MRAKIILLIAILFGIISTLLLVNYLERIEEDKTVTEDTVKVVVAVESIQENQMITASMVEMRNQPKNLLNSGYVTKMEDVVGMLSLSYVGKNEMLNKNRVLDLETEGKSLAQAVAPGYVAMTMDVSDEQGLAQLIKPHDRVNIIYSQTIGLDFMDNDIYDSETVLYGLKVLAISEQLYIDELTEEKEAYETITLEMTLEQAELFTKYKLQGEIAVVMTSRRIN